MTNWQSALKSQNLFLQLLFLAVATALHQKIRKPVGLEVYC